VLVLRMRRMWALRLGSISDIKATPVSADWPVLLVSEAEQPVVCSDQSSGRPLL
jgi:hypothetical protein